MAALNVSRCIVWKKCCGEVQYLAGGYNQVFGWRVWYWVVDRNNAEVFKRDTFTGILRDYGWNVPYRWLRRHCCDHWHTEWLKLETDVERPAPVQKQEK